MILPVIEGLSQMNSFHSPNLYANSNAEFTLMVIFHPNSSRDVVFVWVVDSPPFLRDFITEMVTCIALSPFENSGIYICSDWNLFHLQNVDDVLQLIEVSCKLAGFSRPSER